MFVVAIYGLCRWFEPDRLRPAMQWIERRTQRVRGAYEKAANKVDINVYGALSR